MKRFVVVVMLVSVFSLAGIASNSVTVTKSQTENLEMSKVIGSLTSNTSKAKKGHHHKRNKKARGRKRIK